MSDCVPALYEIVDAEIAATEAFIAAEKLRASGDWYAYPAAAELANARRAKADALKARSVNGIRQALGIEAMGRSLALV